MYDYSGFFSRYGLVLIIAAVLFLIVNRPWQKPHMHRILAAVFLTYVTFVLTLTLNGSYSSPAAAFASAKARILSLSEINLVPFRTIRHYFNSAPITSGLFMVNIVGNIVMFIPWGFFLSLLWNNNRSFLRIFTLSLVFVVGIELFQLFIHRTVDIDDVILNVLGSLLGYWLCLLIRAIIPATRKVST